MAIVYVSDSEIERVAQECLATHWGEGIIPVDVEEIIEIGLGLEIRPITDLNSRFGFEGSVLQDLQTILVDERLQNTENRYRFTLAHELGHILLHKGFIQSFNFGSRDDWKNAVESINSKSYGSIEAQAYKFAGYLLVPREALFLRCEEAKKIALERGIDLDAMGSSAVAYVEGNIAKQFKVSTAVIQRRIDKEGLF